MKVREYIATREVSQVIRDVDIDKVKRPLFVCGKETPCTINDLNMGELIQLQEIRDDISLLFIPCRVLLGVTDAEVLREEYDKVLSFSCWVAKEVGRVNKMFASTSIPPTPDEQQAGADRMHFGSFGLVDHYARRMGITNHEEVERIPWVIVHKCLDMDAQTMRYQRRLRDIMARKKLHKPI